MPLPGKYTDEPPNHTIVLVGMMGAGKTTIGRRLASKLGLPFYDADEEIEKAAGMDVSELFQRHGEKSFRDGEARVIHRLIDKPPFVLATGGGALVNENTRTLIREKTLSIWLKADLETMVNRAMRRDVRPLLKSGDPAETIKNLLKSREPYYALADIHIESQPGPHANTVNLVIKKISEWTDTYEKRLKNEN